MPEIQKTSNGGFRPAELSRREFQETIAAAIDRQAFALGKQQEKLKVNSEFQADLSARLDKHSSDIASIQGAIVVLNRRADRSRWRQVLDFLLGT